jgi:hypothetical protein
MLEIEIMDFVLSNSKEIKADLGKLALESINNPILKSHYDEAMLEEARQYIAKEMRLNYEDVAEIVDRDFVARWLV